jgi:hypothetical protein
MIGDKARGLRPRILRLELRGLNQGDTLTLAISGQRTGWRGLRKRCAAKEGNMESRNGGSWIGQPKAAVHKVQGSHKVEQWG